ncbi:hypothetical protein FQN54_009478 [Arachnomyces sp. PD_36]|nr:hypothetical protein FQN54_009478 [Arachnomyces sp. PD_36]
MHNPPPPSYESATTRDPWLLIAPHILSSSKTRLSDLRAACLVSRRWHEIFIPLLWGDPASHFEGEYEVLDGDGDGEGRERDLFDAIFRFRRILHLARLRVREHTHTLRIPPARSEIYGTPKQSWLRDLLEYLPNLQSLFVSRLSFFDHNSLMALRGLELSRQHAAGRNGDLRLLCADREVNAAPAGLVVALGYFTGLVYLDLSYTATAREGGVLAALWGLRELVVLKMRGVRMRDEGVGVLVGAIGGGSVRVLDLRDNCLTDEGVRRVGSGLVRGEEEVGGGEIRLGGGHGVLSKEGLKGEDLEGRVVEELRQVRGKQPGFEYLPRVGVTHLFISGNKVSADGVGGLLAARRLNVLDAGSVDTDVEGSQLGSLEVSGAERLIPILVTSAGKSLTYLRVSHEVVTKDAPIMGLGLPSSLPSLEDRLSLTHISSSPEEPIHPSTHPSPQSLLTQKVTHLLSKRPTPPSHAFHHTKSLTLHPSHLPNLTTLILTNIPSTVPPSSTLIPSLIRFITSCADESLLAKLQARTNYELPPGRFRGEAERRYARGLFGLQRVILEITPTSNTAMTTSKEQGRKKGGQIGGGWNSEYYHNPGYMKSSTGDEDGERLWAAAANDFSFFGDDGGDEEGDGGGRGSGASFTFTFAPGEKGAGGNDDLLRAEMGPRVDVVAALAEFRRGKRREFEELAKVKGGKAGDGMPVAVEGHWEGEVKIVRNVVG